MREASRRLPSLPWRELAPVVGYANRLECRPGETFGPRCISDYQLLYVAKGKGEVTVQETARQCEAGDLFFYGPGVPHRIRADRRDPFVLYGVHYLWQGPLPEPGRPPQITIRQLGAAEKLPYRDNRFLIGEDMTGDSLLLDGHRRVPPKRFEPFFARLAEAWPSQRAATPLLLRSLLTELLVELHASAAGGDGEGDGPLVQRLAERLRRHAAERYDRDWLSVWTSYHPDYISRLFRSRMRQTPYTYFMSCKLELAREALAHTGEPLAAMAERLRFSSVHAFTRWFVRQTGMPPGRFRRASRTI